MAAQVPRTGIHLRLMVGTKIVVPAPRELAQALRSAQITVGGEDGDGFQLTFALERGRHAEHDLLRKQLLAPMNRVVLGLLFGARPVPLMDGVITHHQLLPSGYGAVGDEARLVVSGQDLSLLLDLEERIESYEGQEDPVIATQVLKRYSDYDIIPRTGVGKQDQGKPPAPQQGEPRVAWQTETDLAFLQRMAARNKDFTFYIEPTALGKNVAYFGPDEPATEKLPALSVNLGPATNVSSLYFRHDALAPVEVSGRILNPDQDGDPVWTLAPPGADNGRLLAKRPSPRYRKIILRGAARLPLAYANAAAGGEAASGGNPVEAEGELDILAYGAVLRPRRVVGVRGAGQGHDGEYRVRSVTHVLAPGSYTQSFTLAREGLGATSPKV